MKTLFLMMGLLLFGSEPSASQVSQKPHSEWIGAEKGRLIWGIKGGIVLAAWPSGFNTKGAGGPRGLFRLGYERDGQMTLVNFVAIEPIVANKRGFSELEHSSIPKQAVTLLDQASV